MYTWQYFKQIKIVSYTVLVWIVVAKKTSVIRTHCFYCLLGFHSPHTIQAYAGSISAALYKNSRTIEKSKTPDKFDILFKRKSKSHSTDTEGGATSDNNNYSKLNSSQYVSICLWFSSRICFDPG